METLIYAVIAGILIYRLYTILGGRDGNEQNRQQNRQQNSAPWRSGNPFAPKNNSGEDKSATPPKAANVNKDDLLALPLAAPNMDAQPSMTNQPFATQPALESLAGALFAIQKADPNFDERGFIKGARVAFEMIVRAFAAGDRGTLKNLLAPKLYVAFEQAVSDRELRGERWEMKNILVRDMDIISASLDGGVALVTVQCVSDQSKFVYDKLGAVVKDGGNEVDRLTDVWTFKRDTKSSNPNWQLAETRPE